MASSKDTTHISNGAFVIVASLAGLSFSCAKAGNGPKNHQNTFVHTGERCFLAGILLLIASILKYALLSIQKVDWVMREKLLLVGGGLVMGSLVNVSFVFALTQACSAVEVLSELLWHRVVGDKKQFGSSRGLHCRYCAVESERDQDD